MSDPIQQYRDALAGRGIIAPLDLLADGVIHRCDAEGRGGKGDAAYLLHLDGIPAGGFENWRDGLGWQNWRADVGRTMTPAEEATHRAKIEAARREREAEEVKRKAEARERANLIWAEAMPCADHPYLTRKGIKAHGVRLYKNVLVIPMRDADGVLHSLQFIDADGGKKFLSGGRVAGCYFSIGNTKGAAALCTDEGFATGATVYEATGHPVAVAFNAGNLLAVTKIMREKFPVLPLILCADDDYQTEGNPGLTKAKEAAQAVNGLVAIPDFGADRPDGATDFNDLHQAQGLEAVRRCIDAAVNNPVDAQAVHDEVTQATTTPDTPPSPADENEELQREIDALATMPLLKYEREYKDAAKRLGMRATVLDNVVKAARSDESEADRRPFVEVEPHPNPIDPAQLLSEVSDTIRLFIVLDAEQAHAAALWCALTWFIDVVEVAPLAIINAPEKSCGKTQLLTVLGCMAYRPLPASNASASALFRAVEKWKPTILIDEADTFFRDNTDLHGMVNAGYLREGFVLRSEAVGDSFEPRTFSVFSAKALAGIALEKHLPDATMSRGIVFNLRRKLSHESVSRLRHADRDLFAGIAEKLARFAADYSQQVRLARPALPDVLSDRDQDNWDGLLAIASCAGDEWLSRATAAALKLSGAVEKTQSTGNELLADIQHIFEMKRVDKISTADLIAALCADEELSWNTYNRGKQLSPRQLSNRLKGYGITSKQMRLNSYDNPYRGFEREQFNDAFLRYLTPPQKLPLHVTKLQEANNSAALNVTDRKSCNVTENLSVTTKANKDVACNAVTDKTPISGVGEECEVEL